MIVRLTERDVRLIAKCACARWLTTGQVQKLLFAQASADAVRKRLRKLDEAGYLRSVRPHRMAETLHTVGKQGRNVLEGKGWEVELERALPRQLDHLIGINDLRMAVESCPRDVVYFYAAWELAQLGWFPEVIPDAVFALENHRRRLTLLAEYDRGTEGMDVLSKKLRRYARGLDEFRFDAALVVTDTEARLSLLARRLARMTSGRRFLGAVIGDVREAGILVPIFVDMRAGMRSERVALFDDGGRS